MTVWYYRFATHTVPRFLFPLTGQTSMTCRHVPGPTPTTPTAVSQYHPTCFGQAWPEHVPVALPSAISLITHPPRPPPQGPAQAYPSALGAPRFFFAHQPRPLPSTCPNPIPCPTPWTSPLPPTHYCRFVATSACHPCLPPLTLPHAQPHACPSTFLPQTPSCLWCACICWDYLPVTVAATGWPQTTPAQEGPTQDS